jgi:hypothetical protein
MRADDAGIKIEDVGLENADAGINMQGSNSSHKNKQRLIRGTDCVKARIALSSPSGRSRAGRRL